MDSTRGKLIRLGLVVLGLVAGAVWFWQRNAVPLPVAGRVLSRTADTLTIGDRTHAETLQIGAETIFRRLDSPVGFTALTYDQLRVGEYVVVSEEASAADQSIRQLDVFPTFPVEATP